MSYSSVETDVPGVTVRRIDGPMVFCLTSAGIRMAIWPPRWIIPKIGGFSSASVPRPGAPFSHQRRPTRPFSHGQRMALVPGHDVHLVALDLAAELHFGLAPHDPLPQS